MTANGRHQLWIRPGLLVAALACGLWGQFLLDAARERREVHPPLPAMCLYAVACLAFWRATRRERSAAHDASGAPRRRAEAIRAACFVAALCALALLSMFLLTVPRDPARVSHAVAVRLWIVGVVLVAVGFAVPLRASALRRVFPRLRDVWARHWWELAAVLLVVLLAGALRVPGLADRPGHLNGDEGSIGIEIQRILRGDLREPFGVTWGAMATLSGYLLASFAEPPGTSIAALRLPGALAGTLAVGALYLLARSFTSRGTALGAALLLATLPMHVHYSRIAVGLAWDPLFFSASLAALLWALRDRAAATGRFLLAGALAGIGQYGYTGARILGPILVAVVVFVAIVDRKRLAGRLRGVLGMFALFVAVALPFYVSGWRYSDEFNERWNQVGILPTGWLATEAARQGRSMASLGAEQFSSALLGFGIRPDRADTWGAWTPYLPPLAAGLAVFGALALVGRWREPGPFAVHAWFWLVVVLGGALTFSPPSSNRQVGALVPACLFVAVGATWVARGIAALARAPRPYASPLAAVLLSAAVAGNLVELRHDSARVSYGRTNARAATFVGRQLAALPESVSLVMLGLPRLPADLSPIRFLAPAHRKIDIAPGADARGESLPSGELLFVATPERVDELRQFARRSEVSPPDLNPEPFTDPRNGEVLYYFLLRPAT